MNIDIKNVEAFIGTAKCYANLENYKEALSHINEAFRLKPESLNALEIRSQIYYNTKDYLLALTDTNNYLLKAPKNIALLINRIIINKELNNKTEICKDYKLMLKLGGKKDSEIEKFCNTK